MNTKRLYNLIVLFICSSVYAQEPFGVYVIDKVPLVIKAPLYVDSLYKDRTFNILSDHIDIYVSPKVGTFYFDIYFKRNNPIDSGQLKLLEYRTFTDDSTNSAWTSVANLTLINRHIAVGAVLTVQFRNIRHKKVIQIAKISRELIKPKIFSFHLFDETDSADIIVKAIAIGKSKAIPAGFTILRGQIIDIAPGKNPEIIFSKQRVNIDSSIQWRIKEVSEHNKPWQTTGHFLSIDNLRANQLYTLDVRYQGMLESSRYYINMLPYWYQTPWARMLFILMAIFLGSLVRFLLKRYRKKVDSDQRRQVEESLKKVQTQLNPHFVFNALSSIEGLVSAGDNEGANKYLNKFSDIMRKTLKDSDEIFTTLKEDMVALEKYIQIEQLRFEFAYEMDVDPGLRMSEIEIPIMLLQPLVENAVKHGVCAKGIEGLIRISYRQVGNDLVIEVLDNGGWKEKQHRDGHGHGVTLTRDKINHLNRLHPNALIEFDLTGTEKETKAQLRFTDWLAS